MVGSVSRAVVNLVVTLLAVSVLVPTPLLAQGGIMAHYSITTASLSPGPGCIYGTKFPWYDRNGKFITTLKGGFTVNSFGYFYQVHAGDISVTVNGLPATVTQSPSNAQNGGWSLDNQLYPMVPTAGDFPIQIHYSGPPNQQALVDPLPIHWNVYTVLPYTLLGGRDIDDIQTSSTMTYGIDSRTGNEVLVSQPISGFPTRRIHNGYFVTGPLGSSLYGISVGIIQTLNESTTPWTVPYHARATGGGTGTWHANFNPNVPLWDGNLTAPPYCGTKAMKPVSILYGTWGGGGLLPPTYTYGINYGINGATYWSEELDEDDSPQLPFPLQSPGGILYDWGVFAGTANRYRGIGNARTDSFEDMLSASYYNVPAVLVPIYGYRSWSCNFLGYLDTMANPQVWIGGSVSASGNSSTQGQSDISRGPANNKVVFTFSIP